MSKEVAERLRRRARECREAAEFAHSEKVREAIFELADELEEEADKLAE